MLTKFTEHCTIPNCSFIGVKRQFTFTKGSAHESNGPLVILTDVVYLNILISLGGIGTDRSTFDGIGLMYNAEGNEERRNNGIRNVNGRVRGYSKGGGEIIRIGICRIVKPPSLGERKKLDQCPVPQISIIISYHCNEMTHGIWIPVNELSSRKSRSIVEVEPVIPPALDAHEHTYIYIDKYLNNILWIRGDISEACLHKFVLQETTRHTTNGHVVLPVKI